jgi:raffinose/stachyose/melibiose transport system substrate-binding protein
LAAPAPAKGVKTLTMWWEGKLAYEEKIRDDQVKDFEKKNPDIKLQRTLQADLTKVVIPAFSSGTAPDVTQTEGDFPMRKGLAEGNHILKLDPFYNDRKWPIFQWARDWAKIKGTTWEVPWEAQTHGLYYNLTALKKLSLQPPKTHDDVIKVADEAKKAGLVPFASDNAGGTNIRRVLMVYMFAIMTPKEVNDILFGEAPYDTPKMLEVVERSQSIFTKGYSDAKLANTLSSDAATPAFAAGRNVFWISGTYNAKRYKAQLKDFPDLDWGYMDLPSVNPAIKTTTNAGIGSAFVINAKTKEQEAALKVIEYSSGLDEYYNKTTLEGLGFVPAMPLKYDGYEIRPDDRYLIDSLARNDAGLQTNKLWPDEMAKYESQAGMGLALGEVTPKEFVSKLAKMWADSKGVPNARWSP